MPMIGIFVLNNLTNLIKNGMIYKVMLGVMPTAPTIVARQTIIER